MLKKDWEKTFQREVKNLGLNGFTVLSMRGNVQVKLRGKDRPTETLVLPFTWEEKSWGDAIITPISVCMSFSTWFN